MKRHFAILWSKGVSSGRPVRVGQIPAKVVYPATQTLALGATVGMLDAGPVVTLVADVGAVAIEKVAGDNLLGQSTAVKLTVLSVTVSRLWAWPVACEVRGSGFNFDGKKSNFSESVSRIRKENLTQGSKGTPEGICSFSWKSLFFMHRTYLA
ncbi:hypothetical protein KUQ09_001056 [Salmonella enterica]|nr:hypothetical protein [Salmonella enterica]